MENKNTRLVPLAFALIAGGIVLFSGRPPGQSEKQPEAEVVTASPEFSEMGNRSASSAVGVEITKGLSQEESVEAWRARPEVLRSGKVALPPIMTGDRGMAKLRLPLLGGESMEVTRWFEGAHGSGQFSISGEIAGGTNGLFSMARSGDAVSGVISSPDASYQYRGTVGGDFYVAEIDRRALAECSGCPEPDPTPEQVAAASQGAPAGYRAGENPQGEAPEGADGDVETIDILIVYTDDVAQRFGGKSGAEADILSTVGLSNQRFRTSNAGARLRVTSMREVEYEENGSADEDLDAITYQDGVIDQVHAWRDADGADLVAMSVARMEFYAGLAWLGGDVRDSEFAVFSVTLHSQLDWAFTHEIGHNLGCAHDRDNAGAGGYRNYSYGYRFPGAGGRTYRTQMAYDPGVRLEQFSNPDLTFDARPTGSNREDNARSIRESSRNVAAFRERTLVSGEGPVIAQISATENPTVSSNTFDGEIQPGEDVRISFDVVNPFDIALTNVRLVVSATDEFIGIPDSSANIPEIAAGGSVSIQDEIRLTVAGNTPVNFESFLVTAFTSDQGTWATSASLFIVPRPIDLLIASFTIEDEAGGGLIGNGNGIAEPGEQFNLRINVMNRGTSTMGRSSGTIRFGDDCLRFKTEDDDRGLPTIEPGATIGSRTFRVIAGDCPLGTRVTVRVDLTSERSGSYTFEKVLVLGTLALGPADIPITVLGDTPVRAGERLQLSPRVKNTGDAIASEVTGAIIELDRGLGSDSDIPLEFGTVNPGVEVGPSRAKSMRVNRYAPVGSEVEFTIEFQSEGESWMVPYALMVEPPVAPPKPPEIDFQAGGGRLGVTVPETHNGMEYGLEWSADMQSWERFGDPGTGTGDALAMEPEMPAAAAGATKIFVRVIRTPRVSG